MIDASFQERTGIVLKYTFVNKGSRSRGLLSKNVCVQTGVTGVYRTVPSALRTLSCFFSLRANFDDTATYSAVATNVHGQMSTSAAVVVRSE